MKIVCLYRHRHIIVYSSRMWAGCVGAIHYNKYACILYVTNVMLMPKHIRRHMEYNGNRIQQEQLQCRSRRSIQ